MFKAYCKHPVFGEAPPVALETVEEVLRYTQLQRHFSPEITVVDEMDVTVVEVKNHKYVLPEEWQVLNK
jgi:hypothetical protein